MASYLYITLGPLKGTRILLREKLTLGRRNAHIDLKDPKASNIHAQALKDSDGNWVIKDMGSRNGIFYEGAKQKRFVLKEGESFLLGDHRLTLKENVKTKKKEQPKWQADLLQFCEELIEKVEDQPSLPTPFTPPISLNILEGLQAGTQWYMGYGPRTVGTSSLDFQLFELGLKDYSFQISPSTQGPSFQTQYPHIVRLNGKAISSEILHDGDLIFINETQMQITFLQ